jgi:putative ABC transport system permease protein
LSESRGVNPLWARSPLVLFRYPGLLVAVGVGALLLAVAAASSPLFLSAAGGSAIRRQLTAVTPFGAGLEVKKSDFFTPPGTRSFIESSVDEQVLDRRTEALNRLVANVDRLEPPVQTILMQPMEIAKQGVPESSRVVRVLARTDALDHVQKLRGGGSGAWISDAWSKELGVEPGDTIVLTNRTTFANQLRQTTVRIAGVYRGLYHEPETPYWRNLHKEIYPASAIVSPPPTFLIVDRPDAVRIGRTLGPERTELHWEFPLDTAGLTVPEAKRIQSQLQTAQAQLTSSRASRVFNCMGQFFGGGCETITSLDTAVAAADQEVSALRGPADLLSTAGTLVALAVVAAAGAFLVARRRTEAMLLHTRGMSPWAFAGKTAVETFLPAAVGTVAGFGIAIGVIAAVGPGGPLDQGAILTAAKAAALRLPIALAVLALVAAIVFLGLSEQARRRAGLLRFVPWEVALLVAAGFCLVQLGNGHALVQEAGGVQRPSAYVLLFPIFFVAGLAGIVARAWGPILGVLRRRSPRLPAGPYLAVHRLAAAQRLAVLLVAACALSLGIFVYAQTIVRSLEHSVVAKSELFVGSDVSGVVNKDQEPPKNFPYPVTKVTKIVRGGEEVEGGAQIDLLAVDPKTFEDAAFWDSSWSGTSVDSMMRDLAEGGGNALPVVVAGGSLADDSHISVDGTQIPIRIVATASAFPGIFEGRPMVVASADQWERIFDQVGANSPLNSPGAEAQLWVNANGDERRAAAFFAASSANAFQILTAAEIRENPSIVAASRTFGFLKSLGFAAGLLAVVGMLLYLQARQRSRIVSYALSRRMGLAGPGHVVALVLELGAMLISSLAIGVVLALIAARVVLGDVDPLQDIPPAPLFRTPVGLLLATVGGLLVVSVIGGILASRAADRANVSEVMRLAD